MRDQVMYKLGLTQILRLLVLVIAVVGLSSCGGGSSTSGGDGGVNPLGFARMLGATFNHPRCQNCHGFETNNIFKIRHEELGRLDQDCANCHFTPGWRAPFQSFSFTGLSTAEICEAIKSKSANDLSRLREGLVNSTLARWGLEDGGTLSGFFPTAPPGSLAEFINLVDQWIAAGATCD